MGFELTVAGFSPGGPIPQRNSCDGQDLSPALKWAGAPAETKGFALIMDDPDAPGGGWNHWLLWDTPASAQSLAEGFKPGQAGVSGTNDFGRQGYGGPCPPRGKGAHRYFFRLFAVNVATLGLQAGTKRGELERALKGRVVGRRSIWGGMSGSKQSSSKALPVQGRTMAAWRDHMTAVNRSSISL